MDELIAVPVRMLDRGVLYPIHKVKFNQNYFNGIRKNYFSIITVVNELFICVYLPQSSAICPNLFHSINSNALHEYNMCYYGSKGKTNVIRIHHPGEGKVNFWFIICVMTNLNI